MDQYCFCFTFWESDKAIRMRAPKTHAIQNCKSAVYSICAQIIENFPFLRPPYEHQGEWVHPKVTEAEPWEGGCFHPYYEIWVDIVLDRLLNHYAANHNGTIYVDVQLSKTQPDHLKIPPSFELVAIEVKSPENTREKVEKVFNLPVTVPSKRRMGIFANQSYKRVGEPFSIRSSKEGLNVGQLYNNDHWRIFRIGEGQVPTIQQLATYDGIILTGNGGSVLELNERQKQAISNLMAAMKISKHLKLLGNCYGHQYIALECGARVVRRPTKGGLEKIRFDKDVKKKFRFLDTWPEADFYQPQNHSDFVVDVPQGFYRLATSDSCEVESLVSKDGRIFTAQFHFEHSYEFMKNYQKRYRFSQSCENGYPFLYIPFDEESEKECNTFCNLGKQCMKKFFEIDQ